jgi:hypothetical protein
LIFVRDIYLIAKKKKVRQVFISKKKFILSRERNLKAIKTFLYVLYEVLDSLFLKICTLMDKHFYFINFLFGKLIFARHLYIPDKLILARLVDICQAG